MTTGTVLAFIFTGITAPVATVSGIWRGRRSCQLRSRSAPVRPLTCACPTRLGPGCPAAI